MQGARDTQRPAQAQQQYEQALDHYEAAEQDPQLTDHGARQFFKGEVLVALGRTNEGIALMEAGLVVRPERPERWFSLAMAYDNLGQHDKAIATFQRLLDRQPTDPQTVKNLAIAYERALAWPSAIATWQRYRDLAPDEPGGYRDMAYALRRNGQWTEAKQWYEQALALAR